jgi:transposase
MSEEIPTTLDEALRVIVELRIVIRQQAALIAELQERLRQDSSNSSKPPSSNGPRSVPPKKKPSGKKRGGQPGHRRVVRALVPPEEVAQVKTVKPSHCDQCRTSLVGTDLTPARYQTFVLPPVRPVVTEYQVHTLICHDCGHDTAASAPPEAIGYGYDAGVDAMVGTFTGVCRLSKRTTAEVMNEVFHVPMSVGSVIGCQQRVSEALAAPVAAAVKYVQRQAVRNADETGWKQATERLYLWTVVTPLVVAFFLRAGRSAKVAKTILGSVRKAILGSDRYSGYSWWSTSQRQVCWAHLIRDFVAIAARGGQSERIGKALGKEADRMFAWWHRVRDGTLERATFQVYMRGLRRRVEARLAEGVQCDHPKTARTCKKMQKVQQAFWTFVDFEGVEPTNNAAEQALRFAVLWRKMSYGTHSAHGSLFVERILTTYMTLRKQQRNVIDFLRRACVAHRTHQPAPSLLPVPATQALALPKAA